MARPTGWTEVSFPKPLLINTMSARYFEILDNPFSPEPVKLNDGLVSESTAVKLRTSGTKLMWLPVTHFYIVPTMGNSVAMMDGVGNGLGTNSSYAEVTPTDHTNATNTVVLNTLYHRLISTAVKLRVLTPTDESKSKHQGYWEAVRVPLLGVGGVDMGQTGNVWLPNYNFTAPFETMNLQSHSSYQYGKMEDLDKYIFKLNFENNKKFFDTNVYKTGYDMIYIRLTRNAEDPQQKIHWKAVSNQEIVYKEPLARLHTECYRTELLDEIIAKTRRKLPGTYAPNLET